MDKISSILPRSSRVKSVDLSDAPPARPGAPTIGRSEGRNSIRDRFTRSEQAKDLALKETLVYKNPKESLRAKMVEDVSKNFFDTRLNPVEGSETSSERVTRAALKVTPESLELPSTEPADSTDTTEVQE